MRRCPPILLSYVLWLFLLLPCLFPNPSALGATCPIQLPIAAEWQDPQSVADFAQRDLSLFMLSGLRQDGESPQLVDGRWQLPCDQIPPSLQDPLANAVDFSGQLDLGSLRALFDSHYLATIPQRRHEAIVRPLFTEMLSATHFRDWPSEIIPFSSIKRKSRHIYRSPAGFEPKMSVSQTLDTENGDASAPILETEIAIKRQRGDSWDFYSYNQAGDLVNYSTFPNGRGPAPRMCMNCHYNPGTHAINRFLTE